MQLGGAKMNKKELIKFEREIFNLFNKGKIKGVIHLSGSEDGKYEDEFMYTLFKKDWIKNRQ